jgi:hypothetical protein
VTTGTKHREPEQVERDARAVELRRSGLNYRQIAAQLTVAVSTAHDMVRRGLTDTVAESNDEVRQLELVRLDHLYRAALGVLGKRHLIVSNGRVALHPETGEALLDSGPILQAMDRLIKIMDRRAKLLGLDAPTRVEMITLGAIEAEIERLEKEMGVAAAPEG